MIRHVASAQLQAVLDELYDKPQLASEMAKNPVAYLKKKGVKIPKNTTSVTAGRCRPPPPASRVGDDTQRELISLSSLYSQGNLLERGFQE